MPGERAGRVDRLHQTVEGDVLVGVGGEVGLPHPAQEFGEGGVTGGVGAQHQRVDEEADQVVQGLVVAAGDRGADRQVGARAEPGEQGGEGRLQHHEHGDLAAAGQPLQTVVVTGVQNGLHGVAAVAGHG